MLDQIRVKISPLDQLFRSIIQKHCKGVLPSFRPVTVPDNYAGKLPLSYDLGFPGLSSSEKRSAGKNWESEFNSVASPDCFAKHSRTYS